MPPAASRFFSAPILLIAPTGYDRATLHPVVALKVQREYAGALKQALTKRTLGGTALSLHDPSSLAVLQRELQSPYPGEVIYALELLEKLEHPSLTAMLVPLLEHPNVNVRQDVLRRLEGMRATAAMAAVRQHLIAETIPQARATAVRTLCALGEVEVVEEVMPYLNHTEPQMRIGAMVGLLRYGGIEGVLVAGERLLSMVHASDPTLREIAAQVLGEVGLQSFYQPLVPLLQDSDPRVCRAALLAAGEVNNARLWPFILPYLSAPTVSRAAIMALVAGGEAVLPALAAAFVAPEQPRETRLAIAQICGRIRGEQAIALLRTALDVPDDAVRSRVLAGLSMCGYIVDGRVRIHNGDQIITYLEARDIFGELAVLDAEPRSASVTAEVNTHLFRLDQDALYELMADRFEVARGIIRMLCRRVRAESMRSRYTG